MDEIWISFAAVEHQAQERTAAERAIRMAMLETREDLARLHEEIQNVVENECVG